MVHCRLFSSFSAIHSQFSFFFLHLLSPGFKYSVHFREAFFFQDKSVRRRQIYVTRGEPVLYFVHGRTFRAAEKPTHFAGRLGGFREAKRRSLENRGE